MHAAAARGRWTEEADERASAYAHEFGARRAYRGFLEMRANEDLDCVFVVTNYDETSRLCAPDTEAPLRWEPEFSLGVLSNDNAFLLGNVPEIRAFCESVLSSTPPKRAGLRDVRQIVRVYDAFRQPAGRTINLTGEVTPRQPPHHL